MRVIFLNGFVGANHSYKAKDTAEVKDVEALALIDAGIAKPEDEKEYEELKKAAAEAKAKEEQLQMEAYAVLKQDELKASASEYAESLHSTLEMIQDKKFISSIANEFADKYSVKTKKAETKKAETKKSKTEEE